MGRPRVRQAHKGQATVSSGGDSNRGGAPRGKLDEGLDIEALVRQAQAGDHRAFQALYERTSGRIYALSMRMCGSPQEAEELTQDVFVRLWEKIGLFRGESAFTTWLHRLAVNLILQKRKKRSTISGREIGTEDLEQFGQTASRSSPGTRVDLERAIASLPEGAREVLVLRDIEGYKYKDVAEMKGVAVGTVKAQVHRARKLVQEALER